MLLIVCMLLGAVIVAVVLLVALCGWAGEVPRIQRLALGAIAAGILWAGPGRAAGGHLSLGDLLFLAGVLAYVLATYGRQLRAHLDAMDGKADGRVNVVIAGEEVGSEIVQLYDRAGRLFTRRRPF